MRTDPDPITEFDLAAYVDDQLPVHRRIAVEAHLAEHPGEAAEMMAALRLRDELRVALSAATPPSGTRTDALARHLQRALGRGGAVRQLPRVAALALMLGVGWFASAEFNALGVRESVAAAPPPTFVADAVRSHATSALRAAMISQIETAEYDPAEILAATAIRLPALPADWVVHDVQVYPSTFGPSVAMALGSPDLGEVSLFAVRPGSFDVMPVGTFAAGEASAAYWQLGEVAYALVTIGGDGRRLRDEADRIADGLR
ncbi:anti-sigma factor [Aureimonas altamirensis]|uniref:anti-sigma factor n=1 Tax=Aureimonas altamirensis TaxID=370622 RepID=UPI002036E10E|nr:anti-sigma factor [Aureimonas altamirensis]MCM2502630.1 anti-sigma factor [Aureimonas altamirensis]